MGYAEESAGGGAAVYRIAVRGRLDAGWSEWLNGMRVEVDAAGGPPVTILTGVSDQAQLRGILARIWDMNLELLSLRRVDPRPRGEGDECRMPSASEPGGEGWDG